MQREVNLLPSSYDLSINWICSVLVGNWSIHLAQWGKRESFLAPKRAQINGELVNSVKCDLSSPISKMYTDLSCQLGFLQIWILFMVLTGEGWGDGVICACVYASHMFWQLILKYNN